MAKLKSEMSIYRKVVLDHERASTDRDRWFVDVYQKATAMHDAASDLLNTIEEVA